MCQCEKCQIKRIESQEICDWAKQQLKELIGVPGEDFSHPCESCLGVKEGYNTCPFGY